MTPILIIPETDIFVSKDVKNLTGTQPTKEPRIVMGEVFVLPCGKETCYSVRVDGFSNGPGGMLQTERLSPGHNVDEITLTTPKDKELIDELGVTAIKIDGVLYEAIDVDNR